ncbi:E3 ubiquitin-protein ligase UBR4-like, partial [Lampetra fluviatilis]
MAHRPQLEELLVRISEAAADNPTDDSVSGGGGGSIASSTSTSISATATAAAAAAAAATAPSSSSSVGAISSSSSSAGAGIGGGAGAGGVGSSSASASAAATAAAAAAAAAVAAAAAAAAATAGGPGGGAGGGAGGGVGVGGGAASSSSSCVNKHIQALAHKYCGECRLAFEGLSKIIQKVLASRKQLVEYDLQQREAASRCARAPSAPPTPTALPPSTEPPLPPPPPASPTATAAAVPVVPVVPAAAAVVVQRVRRCYGCASAVTEHCVTLLQALATNATIRAMLVSQGLIGELFGYNMRRGTAAMRRNARSLLCLLTRDNKEATQHMNELIVSRVAAAIRGHWTNPDMVNCVNEMMLLTDSISLDDQCWEERLRCAMSLFLMAVRVQSPLVVESVSLPCLRILQRLIRPQPLTRSSAKEVPLESRCSVRPYSSELHAQVEPWLAAEPRASFLAWRRSLPARGNWLRGGAVRPGDRAEFRRRFLAEKFAWRWRLALQRGGRSTRLPPLELQLGHNNWLRQILFTPSSQAARQAACAIVEALGSMQSRKQQVLDLLT